MDAPGREPPEHFFLELARHAGPAYLRYSFTKGTEQEVEALVRWCGLGSGDRVLDVGCGPGRHALALGRRGVEVVGVDLSTEFVDLARAAAVSEDLPCRFLVGDARALGRVLAEAGEADFDAALSLCQGAFGLLGAPGWTDGDDPERGDLAVLAGMTAAVRPGGHVVVSAFNAWFALAGLDADERFDAATGTIEERTAVRDPLGRPRDFTLWTTTFTPRELRLLARLGGLEVVALHAVRPGRYVPSPPSVAAPEHVLIGRRPLGETAPPRV